MTDENVHFHETLKYS